VNSRRAGRRPTEALERAGRCHLRRSKLIAGRQIRGTPALLRNRSPWPPPRRARCWTCPSAHQCNFCVLVHPALIHDVEEGHRPRRSAIVELSKHSERPAYRLRRRAILYADAVERSSFSQVRSACNDSLACLDSLLPDRNSKRLHSNSCAIAKCNESRQPCTMSKSVPCIDKRRSWEGSRAHSTSLRPR
jgi:hypothetical protein